MMRSTFKQAVIAFIIAFMAASLASLAWSTSMTTTGAGVKASGGGGGQVTFDAASADVLVTTTQSVSITHTAAGSDRAAFVFAYCSSSFAGFIDGSATYGATAMTRLFQNSPDATNYYAAFVLAAPATGAQTVTVSFTAEDCDIRTIAVVTANGVNQGTPVGTVQNATATTGTTPSVTVTGLVANGLIVDGIMAREGGGGTTITVGANQLLKVLDNATSTFLYQQGASTQLSSDGGVMSWTKDVNFDFYIAAIEFKPL